MRLFSIKNLVLTVLISAGSLLDTNHCQAQSKIVFKIKADKPLAKIQSTMWGVFFEDINFGADGGIYAELIKNRSFEFPKPLMGWTVERTKGVFNDILIINNNSDATNRRYLRVNNNSETGNLSLFNEGFRGIGVKKGLQYNFSLMYRQQSSTIKLQIKLISAKGDVIGEGTLTPQQKGNEWKKQTLSFVASETDPKAKFQLLFEGTGTIDLDMISLFPEDTWKKRPGGLRSDMVQMIADMKPGFIRFPGGCIVEGGDLENRYQWKKTLGPVEDRQLIINRWNQWHASRQTPDYFQTFGLGFFEYFELCEDVGAEPLPILNCGMSCQFNAAELVELSQLEPYVQDALDLVEFANGNIGTKWGKVRSDLGHSKPFGLKMIGIGNENWGPQYLERLKIFTKAIKAKYPEIKVVNSAGPGPEDDRFEYMNTELRKINTDLIDEHYYKEPGWFLKNANRYDTYPKNGSKVLAGEYAAKVKGTAGPLQTSSWQCALAEACFMTGLERNADVVQMASYAPLFSNVDAWQWSPDLIWVDNLTVFGTPGYYVQKLFSINKGTDVISILLNGQIVKGKFGLYASSVVDVNTNDLIIKIANNSNKLLDADFVIEGSKKIQAQAVATELSSININQLNSFENAGAVAPKQFLLKSKGQKINLLLKPNSFNVVRIPFK